MGVSDTDVYYLVKVNVVSSNLIARSKYSKFWLNILSHDPLALVHAGGGIEDVFTHPVVENS